LGKNRRIHALSPDQSKLTLHNPVGGGEWKTVGAPMEMCEGLGTSPTFGKREGKKFDDPDGSLWDASLAPTARVNQPERSEEKRGVLRGEERTLTRKKKKPSATFALVLWWSRSTQGQSKGTGLMVGAISGAS